MQALIWSFQLMCYMMVLSFWLVYAMGYGIYRLIVWVVDAIQDGRQQTHYDDNQDE